MAGHDDSHGLTLPQVTGAFRVEGSWPSPISITGGWGRAVARPWNDESPDGYIRLVRGRAEFLESATLTVAELSGSGVFSPAVFPASARIWARAGFREVEQLDVMERPLGLVIDKPRHHVEIQSRPTWERILEIDRAAFDGFWRMSRHGLVEAFESTRKGALLTVAADGEITGYAILGFQWGLAYLQRMAVEPGHSGKGMGTDLVRSAIEWGRSTRAATMVLNVRRENASAKRIYSRLGFGATGTRLRILRHGSTTLLD